MEVHASQGLKVGLYTPTILGGNSYLTWFYDRGQYKTQHTHAGTSKGLSQAINRGPIRKLLPKYANVSITIQSHGLSAGVRPHYVTANGVRNGLPWSIAGCFTERQRGLLYMKPQLAPVLLLPGNWPLVDMDMGEAGWTEWPQGNSRPTLN